MSECLCALVLGIYSNGNNQYHIKNKDDNVREQTLEGLLRIVLESRRVTVRRNEDMNTLQSYLYHNCLGLSCVGAHDTV